MKESIFNYQKALRDLKFFNRLVLGQEILSNLFVYRDYDLLAAFQTSIFSDFKSRTKFGSIEVLPQLSLIKFVKNFFIFSFLFVVSLTSLVWLIVSRKKILVFSGDKVSSKMGRHDFRLDPLYDALEESRTPFLEVVHTTPSKESLVNFFKRRRPVVYLETFDWLSAPLVSLVQRRVKKLLNKDVFKDVGFEEKEFFRELVIKYASATEIFKIRLAWLKLVLRLSGVRSIFSIDDVRHYNELVLASRLSGVRFVAIQHGHFTKYHVGWLKNFPSKHKIIRPDQIVVWSRYWRDELLNLGTYYKLEEIVVGGVKDHLTPSDVRQEAQGRIGVLLPYETDAPFKDVTEYVRKIVSDPRFKLIFKLRADLSDELQLSQYGLSGDMDFESTHSTRDVLSRVGVVVGTYSTFLYDMVAELRPVGILETSIDYGEGMVLGGLAGRVALQTMEEDLLELSQVSQVELEGRRSKLLEGSNKLLKDYLKTEIQNALSD